MEVEEFTAYVKELLFDCEKVLTSKGADYTRGDKDKLINFKSSGDSLGVSPLQVAGVFLRKQLDPIFKYIKDKRLESEPVESRIIDSINYLILLYALVKEDKDDKAF